MSTVMVIMPTHNRGYCIADSIKSVLKQSLKDLILIVVDDASSDETESIVSEMAKQEARLIFVRRDKPNNEVKTASNAINFGLKHILFDQANSTLEKKILYITQVHSDDFLHIHSIEKRVATLKHESAGAVYTDALAFDLVKQESRLLQGKETSSLKDLLIRTHVQTIPNFTMMWKKDLVKDIMSKNSYEFYDPSIGSSEDIDVSSKTIVYCMQHSLDIRYIKGYVGSFYRINPVSLARQRTWKEAKKNFDYVEKKYFSCVGVIQNNFRRFLIRPTHSLPFKFRRRFLTNLENRIYKKRFTALDTALEKNIFWFN